VFSNDRRRGTGPIDGTLGHVSFIYHFLILYTMVDVFLLAQAMIVLSSRGTGFQSPMALLPFRRVSRPPRIASAAENRPDSSANRPNGMHAQQAGGKHQFWLPGANGAVMNARARRKDFRRVKHDLP
jgi:hypothetical protein